MRLPLRASANIVHGDALELDWDDVVPNDELSYIIGNPPFVGARLMSKEQSCQVEQVFDNIRGAGILIMLQRGMLRLLSISKTLV